MLLRSFRELTDHRCLLPILLLRKRMIKANGLRFHYQQHRRCSMEIVGLIISLSLISAAITGIVYRYKSSKKYVVNYYSKEIHSATSKDKRCKIHNMTNCEHIGRHKMNRLLKNGYNGCRYCLPEFDTDLIDYKKNTEKR